MLSFNNEAAHGGLIAEIGDPRYWLSAATSASRCRVDRELKLWDLLSGHGRGSETGRSLKWPGRGEEDSVRILRRPARWLLRRGPGTSA